ETIAVGHLDIGEDQIRVGARGARGAFREGGSRDDLEAALVEVDREHVADGRLVVDDQETRPGAHAAPAFVPAGSAARSAANAGPAPADFVISAWRGSRNVN